MLIDDRLHLHGALPGGPPAGRNSFSQISDATVASSIRSLKDRIWSSPASASVAFFRPWSHVAKASSERPRATATLIGTPDWATALSRCWLLRSRPVDAKQMGCAFSIHMAG